MSISITEFYCTIWTGSVDILCWKVPVEVNDNPIHHVDRAISPEHSGGRLMTIISCHPANRRASTEQGIVDRPCWVGHRLVVAPATDVFLVFFLFLLLICDIVPLFYSFLEGIEFLFGFGLMESSLLVLSFFFGIVSGNAPVRLVCCCCWCSRCEFSCLVWPIGFPVVQNDP